MLLLLILSSLTKDYNVKFWALVQIVFELVSYNYNLRFWLVLDNFIQRKVVLLMLGLEYWISCKGGASPILNLFLYKIEVSIIWYLKSMLILNSINNNRLGRIDDYDILYTCNRQHLINAQTSFSWKPTFCMIDANIMSELF